MIDTIWFSKKQPFQCRDLLHQKYIVEGLSTRQIAAEFFCSRSTIKKYLKEHGIELRRPHLNHGRPSQPRYGQRLVRGSEVEHLTEQRVIKVVNDLREQGLSLRQICRFLSQIGVPTKKRGVRWHPEMVNRILSHNPSCKIEALTGKACQQTMEAL